ncbi:two-component system activity regulator YycH, partial [Pseudomonas sp. 2822-17]|uniref:two-component system activity regulator YycH n=1 Tax=Pseudomonas sp. 2822-17 TaxID=1712678 RepID=UPI001C4820F9
VQIQQLISTYTRPPSKDNRFEGIELAFSQKLDGEWIQRIFDLDGYEMPLETVDRIILYVNDNLMSSDVIIRFISLDEERMFQANA